MSAEDEDRAAFDDGEYDLEDTEGDDSDMDDDEEDDDAGGEQSSAPLPPPPPPSFITDLNAASSQPQKPNPNPNPNPSSAPALLSSAPNGAVQGFVPVPAAVTVAVTGGDMQTSTPDSKRPRIEERRPQPSASVDESRRLFQRLWTDDDEIKILKGFLEFTSSRGTTFATHQYDTGPFYEKIKNELQLDFNKNQLTEKLRRLKKKYRNTANRMANQGKDFTFKSPHESATYDISRKIWSASIKISRDSDEDDLNPYTNNMSDTAVSSDGKVARSRRRNRKRSLGTLPVTPMLQALPAPLPPPVAVAGSAEGVVKAEVQTAPMTTPMIAAPTSPEQKLTSNSSAPQIHTVIEETVKSCLSPILKELLSAAMSAPLGLGVNLPPLLDIGGNLTLTDERWRKQQILELEVYLKRVELVHDQIKSTLDELKASQPTVAPAPRV